MSTSTKAQTQSHKRNLSEDVDSLLAEIGVNRSRYWDGELKVHTPITGEIVGRVRLTDARDSLASIEAAHAAFRAWSLVPAPKRGELVRLLSDQLRANKEPWADWSRSKLARSHQKALAKFRR